MNQLSEAINASATLANFQTSNVAGDYWPITWSYPWPTATTYVNWSASPNKTEQAYQVLRALMRAKVIKIETLPKFFDAMDEILKVL